jgi:hypothetical protein
MKREMVSPIHAPRGAVEALFHDLLERGMRSKDQFQYLLRGKSVLDLAPAVLESIARIDGAIVTNRSATLLAFGAILRHQPEPGLDENAVEGGRTTAAIAASRYGHVLKVSEDGLVSYYSAGRCIWEL